MYGIRRHPTRKCDFKCPAAKKCSDIFTSQRKVNKHIKEAHPNFGFMCSYCLKHFQTYNANYKHEKKHAGRTHKCVVKGCNKIFMYKKDLENHMKIHTGVGLIPCTHCKKQFTTSMAMCAHSKLHLNKVHNCATCGKSFSTKPYLLQHAQGKHGKGYIAFCRAQYRWPKKCTIMRNTAKTVFIWTKNN